MTDHPALFDTQDTPPAAGAAAAKRGLASRGARG